MRTGFKTYQINRVRNSLSKITIRKSVIYFNSSFALNFNKKPKYAKLYYNLNKNELCIEFINTEKDRKNAYKIAYSSACNSFCLNLRHTILYQDVYDYEIEDNCIYLKLVKNSFKDIK